MAEINAASDCEFVLCVYSMVIRYGLQHFVVSVLFCNWPLFHVRTPNLQKKENAIFFSFDAKMLSASGGRIPRSGALPLDPTGGTAPRPSCRLALAIRPISVPGFFLLGNEHC